jgi:hypothetical protein
VVEQVYTQRAQSVEHGKMSVRPGEPQVAVNCQTGQLIVNHPELEIIDR